jgi:hypothetical protein
MNLPNNAAADEPAQDADGWQSTRAQTQLVRDENDYLGSAAARDVGRHVGSNQHELFVSCDPGPALQQQFEHLQPESIALHDVATRSTRKLLLGVAKASQREVQSLVIRRQGHGNTLATIEFVELPNADGSLLRIYSTEADAETRSRHAIAHMLLGFSTLGAVMVGDVPGHSISGTFKPLHDDMIAGPWPNRHLLLLPLTAANPLVTQGMELSRGTGVSVRTTPQVTRPADAWNFISSTWSRLRDERAAVLAPQRAAVAPPRPAGPLPMRPMPAVPASGSGSASASAAPQDILSRYVRQLSELTGMISVCVFDIATGRHVAHAGAKPGAAELGAQGSEILATMLTSSRLLGLGHAMPEAAITLQSHHLVLRSVPKHVGLAIHAVLDKTNANLTLARLQIMRMDALFDEA